MTIQDPTFNELDLQIQFLRMLERHRDAGHRLYIHLANGDLWAFSYEQIGKDDWKWRIARNGHLFADVGDLSLALLILAQQLGGWQ